MRSPPVTKCDALALTLRVRNGISFPFCLKTAQAGGSLAWRKTSRICTRRVTVKSCLADGFTLPLYLLMPAVKPPIIPLKYVVGIDIAKDSFVACLGYLEVNQQLHFGKEVTFDRPAALRTCSGGWPSIKLRLVRAGLW